MCHADDSRPPAPPRSGPVAHRELRRVASADGAVMQTAIALPESSAGVGVVVLPDVRGLHPYYVALASRFAEAGLPAIAVDYYGRTAGAEERDADFDWQQHIGLVEPDKVAADVAAAVAALREAARSPDLPVITLGFCFGGGLSWRLAAADVDLAGVVGFYGRPDAAAEVAGGARRPVLMLVAGADANIPLESTETLADALRKAGVQVERQVYEGAPHSFFDRTFAEHAEACADAWRRILDFAEHVK